MTATGIEKGMMMLKYVVPALLICTMPAFAQTTGGSYTVAGTNPGGAAYAGTADITISDADCTVTWAFGNGKAEGTCLQADGVLATSYVVGDMLTLVLYRVGADGVLNGVWSVGGKAGTGTEVLTPK